MISTRSAGLVIDTVVCLALAKWETVSGRFVGYLRGPLTGFELLQALPAAQTANLRRLAILRRVGGSAAHGSWKVLAPSRAFRTKPNSAYVITALAVAVVAARDVSCRFQ